MSEKSIEPLPQLTLFVAGSPAKTCQSQTLEAEDSKATRAGCGGNMPESLTSSAQPSSSLRTCRDWYGGDWTSLSSTSSDAVTRWRPAESEPKTSEPRTDASGCSLWATPVIKGNYNKASLSKAAGDGLATQVTQWPTPTAPTYGSNSGGAKPGHKRPSLAQLVKWPTPCATDWKGGDRRGQLTEAIPGVLNPDWVEMLMGFRQQWTDLDEHNGQIALFDTAGR